MIAGIDIQTVWSESKGEVQLFIGDFRIGLPPALCEQLEKDLAAARRVPERARLMADYKPSFCKTDDPLPRIRCVGQVFGGPIGGAMSESDAITDRATISMGGVSDCSAGDPVASE